MRGVPTGAPRSSKRRSVSSTSRKYRSTTVSTTDLGDSENPTVRVLLEFGTFLVQWRWCRHVGGDQLGELVHRQAGEGGGRWHGQNLSSNGQPEQAPEPGREPFEAPQLRSRAVLHLPDLEPERASEQHRSD